MAGAAGRRRSGHGAGLLGCALTFGFVAASVAVPSQPTSGALDGGAGVPNAGGCNPGDTLPCTLSNGCPAEKTCTAGHYGPCLCPLGGGGGTASCLACGASGTATCNSSCALGPCQVNPNPCNPNACKTGGTQTCNLSTNQWNACTGCSGTGNCTACGSAGTGTCDSTCAPPAASCQVSGSCVTSCNSTGTHTCNASTNQWNACIPPAETCNNLDDDCDGVIDNGVACDACSY